MCKLDINCDMGESFGRYRIGNDEEVIKYITSANIACGFHAGDPNIMRKTVQLALKHGVAIGAHPGFDDLRGFGRREINVSAADVYNLVIYQIGAIQAFVTAEGGTLEHVKPHGALYNIAARRKDIAEAIAEAVYAVNPELILFGLANSESIAAAKRIGLRVAREVFADRTYEKDGTLTPRERPNALITDPEKAIAQVLSIVKRRYVVSTCGSQVPLTADTVCIHGDGSDALTFAEKLQDVLRREGVTVTRARDIV